MKEPIIILTAPNGAKKTKKDHPNIPLFPEEIGVAARDCRDAGAALIHLHIRDERAVHTIDVDGYKKAIAAIKNQLGDDLIIQVTSESVEIFSPEEQIAMVRELKPEAVSLAIREIIPTQADQPRAAEFFAWLQANKIAPQFILYSPEEVKYFARLVEEKIIPQDNKFVLFVLGKKNGPNIESAYAKPEDLHPFVDIYEKYLKSHDVKWAVCAFGGYENKCMLEAVKLGGHVRIGFENNILMADGSIAPDNAVLIRQFVNSLPNGGRPIANVKTAKEMLGMVR